MGTSLTGLTPATTYDALIKVGDNGPLSATAKVLSDGLGNDSILALSTSRVGVATTSPLTTLQVGNTTINNAAIGSSLVRLLSRSTANDVQEIGLGGEGSATISAIGNIITDGSNFAKGAIYFATRDVTTNTDPTERMRITSAGNVGIGTSSPDNTLDLGSPSQGRALTFDNYSNLFSAYSSGDFILSNNFYGSTSSDTYLTSATATFGAAGIRVSATSGTSLGGQIQFFANTATSKTAGTAFTPTEICRVTPNGLTFNGDTAAANALDDYEEGTWTPGITFGGSTTGITYSQNVGSYTKIGRQVTVNGYIALSSKGSATGSGKITGLPFTIPNNADRYATVSLWFNNVSFVNQYLGYGVVNNTIIDINQITNLGALSGLSDTNFSNNSEVMINFTYFV